MSSAAPGATRNAASTGVVSVVVAALVLGALVLLPRLSKEAASASTPAARHAAGALLELAPTRCRRSRRGQPLRSGTTASSRLF